MNSWDSVRQFEQRVAEFSGSKYAVAVDSCTNAIFLCIKYLGITEVTIPKRTYVSVPMAAIHAGAKVTFSDHDWSGVYGMAGQVIDSACRFHKGMYWGGFQCLSFQAKKKLPIGKGGMILTNDEKAVKWLTKARACGRDVSLPLEDDNIKILGWNMVMTPEQASRGLWLMESMTFSTKDLKFEYPDCSKMWCFL